MAITEFSQAETTTVTERYPRLLRVSHGSMQGEIDVNAEYQGSVIADSFSVRITASNPNSIHVPALYEIGGRTESIAKQYGITDLRALHRNPDGTACLCVKQVERRNYPAGSTLPDFVEAFVVPYLYSLAHFEKCGKFPWGDFSHGGLGLLEFASDDTEQLTEEGVAEIFATFRRELNWKEYHKQLRKPSAERACLCGSRKPFHKCHGKAWRGVIRLRAEVERLKLHSKALFTQRG